MRMLKSNFECALFLAIRRQEAEGCGETILTQGFRDILEASQKGEKITIATSTKTILYKQH